MTTTLDVAKAVLAKASFVDPTMPRPDLNVARAWAEMLDDCDQEAALRAVTGHYADEHRQIRPADVNRRLRADRSRLHYEIPALEANRVPNADPDDVPAWLAALRAGDLVDATPPIATPRPMGQILAAQTWRMPKPDPESSPRVPVRARRERNSATFTAPEGRPTGQPLPNAPRAE